MANSLAKARTRTRVINVGKLRDGEKKTRQDDEWMTAPG